MNNIRVFSLAVLLSLASSGCTVREELASDGFGNLGQTERERTVCGRKWAELMDEWRENGGGFKSSLAATREQIRQDQTSLFSRYVRAAWDKQSDQDMLGHAARWPLSDDDLYRVGEAFRQANGDQFPGKCFILFDHIIWRELHASKPEGGKYVGSALSVLKFSDAPDVFEWESPNAQWWTEYWLLRRIEEPAPKRD